MTVAIERYPHDTLIIRVWNLNTRALKVYERVGFSVVSTEKVVIDGMPFTFLVLTWRR